MKRQPELRHSSSELGSELSESQQIPEEIKEQWPRYLKKRFEAARAAYDLNFSKLSEIFQKDPSLSDPELLFLLSFRYQNLKKHNKQPPVIDKTLLKSFIENLPPQSSEQVEKKEFVLKVIELINNLDAPEVALSILRDFTQDEDPNIREQTAKVLGKMGREALELLKQLAKDPAFRVRQQVAESLGELGDRESVFETLKDLLQEDEPTEVRFQAAKSLRKIGEIQLARRTLRDLLEREKENPEFLAQVVSELQVLGEDQLALNLLQDLIKNPYSWIRQMAIKFLPNFGKKALPILKNLAKDNDPLICRLAIKALVPFGKESLQFLQDLAQHQKEELSRRIPAIEALYSLGEIQQALRAIKILIRDSNPIKRVQGAMVLGKLGEAGSTLLSRLLEDENDWVQAQAIYSLNQIKLEKFLKEVDKEKFIYSLIFRQEPLLANPIFSGDIEKQILVLSDIVKDLQIKDTQLVGLVVLGSFSKGYYLPGSSDLDWALIYSSPEDISEETSRRNREMLIEEFKQRATDAGFVLCVERFIDISQIETTQPSDLQIVFNGIFIGDRKKLLEAQVKILKKVDEKKWERIRSAWRGTLGSYSKALDRFHLTEQELLVIKHTRDYLWSLPDYQTMLAEIRMGSYSC